MWALKPSWLTACEFCGRNKQQHWHDFKQLRPRFPHRKYTWSAADLLRLRHENTAVAWKPISFQELFGSEDALRKLDAVLRDGVPIISTKVIKSRSPPHVWAFKVTSCCLRTNIIAHKIMYWWGFSNLTGLKGSDSDNTKTYGLSLKLANMFIVEPLI